MLSKVNSSKLSSRLYFMSLWSQVIIASRFVWHWTKYSDWVLVSGQDILANSFNLLIFLRLFFTLSSSSSLQEFQRKVLVEESGMEGGAASLAVDQLLTRM